MTDESAAVAIAPESPEQPDVLCLLAASDRYHRALYPSESNHLVDAGALATAGVRFLVARLGGRAVGCGAVLLTADGYAELKRMWVDPAARGLGLGRRILASLEAIARAEGIAVVRLETGIHQPEAVGLYRANGYADCDPFASYTADPLSVFMEKRLV